MLQNTVVHICVGLILYGDSDYCLEALAALKQQELDEGTNISLVIVDNGIPDTLKAEIWALYAGQMLYLDNLKNLGFSAGANQCLEEAQKFNADFLLLLNPDLLLETVAIRELIRAAKRHAAADFFTPKLLRANQDLSPSDPAVLDACGMQLYKNIRHLDRGSGELDKLQYQDEQPVFGATGACLFIRMANISKLCLPRNKHEADLYRIYPQLEQGANSRPQLFDESFFAYREDADLSLRAQIKGYSFIYCPTAVGYHVRKVLPDIRHKLSADINMYGVRNRFLLQINNLKFFYSLSVFLNGFLLRNIMVFLAVMIKERTSIRAFKDLLILKKRALANRKFVLRNVTKTQYQSVLRWFS